MQILFISESYIERTLLGYFKQNNKHTFILLKSNHPEIKNCVEDNIHVMHPREALALCDCIYILGEEKISALLFQQCQETAKNRKIPIYYGPKTPPSKKVEKYLNDIPLSKIVNLPIVLLLQVGVNAQLEKTELHICDLIRRNKVNYILHTNTWSPQINKMAGLLNINVAYNNSEIDAQLAIVSIKENILDLVSNNVENVFFDIFLRTIRPDYIVMCCENDYKFHDELNNIFIIKYSRPIDVFVKSEYVTLKENNDHKTSLFVEHLNNNNLFDDIRTKLTFPHGVREINI